MPDSNPELFVNSRVMWYQWATISTLFILNILDKSFHILSRAEFPKDGTKKKSESTKQGPGMYFAYLTWYVNGCIFYFLVIV